MVRFFHVKIGSIWGRSSDLGFVDPVSAFRAKVMVGDASCFPGLLGKHWAIGVHLLGSTAFCT
jgi:hypothetical protein